MKGLRDFDVDLAYEAMYTVGGVLIFASMGAGMMYLMKNSSRGGEDDEHKETMD